MTDFTPIFIVVLFTVIAFVSAMKHGVVKLLSSGCAATLALGIVWAGFRFLPELASEHMDIELTWKAVAGVSAGIAIVVYFVALLIFGFFFKAFFNPDGWFHRLADGIPGGIISLFPSAVVAVFLFTCVRIAGTLQELNYAASLSQDGISESDRRVPPYPFSADWRNGIEDVPMLASLLDPIDPFSKRRNRNAAAMVIMGQSAPFRSHLLSQPETAELADEQEWFALRRDKSIKKALEKHDRVGLVLDPNLRDVASKSEFARDLRTLKLKRVLTGFAKSLEPKTTPTPE
ncbi:MAG: hypothetical protein WD342_13715 [Verrucomicrobiales bacterium]